MKFGPNIILFLFYVIVSEADEHHISSKFVAEEAEKQRFLFIYFIIIIFNVFIYGTKCSTELRTGLTTVTEWVTQTQW